MADKRLELLSALSALTISGKLKWKPGAKSRQYIVHSPGGNSFVISQSDKYVGGLLAGISQATPTFSKSGRMIVRQDDGYIYILQVRDKHADVIDELSSEAFMEEEGALGEIPGGLKRLYYAIHDSIDRTRNRQLDEILRDLTSLE